MPYSSAQLRCLNTCAVTIIFGMLLVGMGWGQGWYWLVSWGFGSTAKVWALGTFVALAAGLGEVTRPAPVKWFAPVMAAFAVVLCGWSLLAYWNVLPFPQVLDPTAPAGATPGLMSPITAVVGLIDAAVLVALHAGRCGPTLVLAEGISFLLPMAVLAGWWSGEQGLSGVHGGTPMAVPAVVFSVYLSVGGFWNATNYVAGIEQQRGRHHASDVQR